MKKKVAVLTGSRAEYGVLKALLEKIKESPELDLKLLVTGMHLLDRYGLTVSEVEKDGFAIDAQIPMYLEDETDDTCYGKALARGIEGITQVLQQMGPDILVVTGDRLEPMAATLAATPLRIPIAHIHGGEKTDSGHIDEALRHSITRFAHIHFTATPQSAERLLKMGEEPWRVHNVGALSLDNLLSRQFESKDELTASLGLDLRRKIVICVFHPVHLEREDMGRQAREILEAIREIGVQTVIIYPNNDAGSSAIINEIEKYKPLAFVKIFPSLPYQQYASLLKHADALVGNSSSGITEAPSLGLPVVNIGSRNVGREHTENVIFVDANKDEVVRAIGKALNDTEFTEKVKHCHNPYGDGKASDRIIKILKKLTIDDRLMRKRITY